MSEDTKDLMCIWDHAKKTDPSATKSSNVGGYKSTSISGYWMIKKATELWGPLGGAWGYEVIEERFDEGSPISDDETGVILCKTTMHTIKLSLYHPHGKNVTQYGHTPFIYKTKRGPITDMEAPKKSLMDAIKKSLSMLGFSADIFTGEFDDFEYQEQLRNEESVKKADDKDAEIERQRSEYKQWFSDIKSTMSKSRNPHELEAIFKTAYRKIHRRGDNDLIKELTIEKDRVKKLLGEQGEGK